MRDLADRAAGAPAVRTLLTDAIDYAGLFPPAALSMDDTVRNYAAYLDSEDAWALGRLVVPIARLGEFAAVAEPLLGRGAGPWRLSLLAGPQGADEWSSVHRTRLRAVATNAIELRVRSMNDVLEAAGKLPKDIDVYYEIPVDEDPSALIGAIRRVRGKAKVRTGGVTDDAFPLPTQLARFIVQCAAAGVPFKATAGLHHPLRAAYRLTYATDSPHGEMFGFLNVLLAAAFAREELGIGTIAELLDERDIESIRFDRDGVTWRARRVSLRRLADARAALSLSFGSCSFTEPLNELRQLGWL